MKNSFGAGPTILRTLRQYCPATREPLTGRTSRIRIRRADALLGQLFSLRVWAIQWSHNQRCGEHLLARPMRMKLSSIPARHRLMNETRDIAVPYAYTNDSRRSSV